MPLLLLLMILLLLLLLPPFLDSENFQLLLMLLLLQRKDALHFNSVLLSYSKMMMIVAFNFSNGVDFGCCQV